MLKENFVNLPESLLAKYISKCLKGLAYLHENKIIHNDLKGVNILVTRDGQVKLADCVQPKLKGKKDALVIQPYWSLTSHTFSPLPRLPHSPPIFSLSLSLLLFLFSVYPSGS